MRPRDDIPTLDAQAPRVNLEPLSYRLDAACAVSGIPKSSLCDAINRGELPVCKYGGGKLRDRYVILRVDLIAFLESIRVTK